VFQKEQDSLQTKDREWGPRGCGERKGKRPNFTIVPSGGGGSIAGAIEGGGIFFIQKKKPQNKKNWVAQSIGGKENVIGKGKEKLAGRPAAEKEAEVKKTSAAFVQKKKT